MDNLSLKSINQIEKKKEVNFQFSTIRVTLLEDTVCIYLMLSSKITVVL